MSHLITAPRCAGRSPLQEEGNVGAERRSHLLKPHIHEPQPKEPVHADQKSRRVAASASETRSDRNPFREPYAHAAPIVPRALLHERPRSLDNVGAVFRNPEAARLEIKSLPSLFEKKLVFE